MNATANLTVITVPATIPTVAAQGNAAFVTLTAINVGTIINTVVTTTKPAPILAGVV